MQFVFRDAANTGKPVIDGNVHQVVQVAEHADLTELRHTRQQGKAQVVVIRLQRAVEGFQRIAVVGEQRFVADSLEHGLIIFVHQHHHFPSCLLCRTADDAVEAAGYSDFTLRGTVEAFPIAQVLFQYVGQCFGCIISLCVQIEMQNRMYSPVLFQSFHSQSLEEFLPSQEVSFQCRDEQTLTEAAWTTQEVILPGFYQAVNKRSLVDVTITAFTYFFKTLYAYRINLAHGFSVISDCFCKNSERREQRQTKNKVFQFDYAEPYPILFKNSERKKQRCVFVDAFC